MASYVVGPTRSFTAGAAIGQHLRVSLSAGKLAAAGANTQDIGTLVEASFADGDVRAVHLANAQGTCKMVASAAVTAGALVYAAASGKVSATKTSILIGRALEAATNDGDIIEVMRFDGLKIVYGVHTTVAASDTVVTGLSTVVAVVATLSSDPILAASAVTATIGDQAGAPAAGSVLIKTWKATSSSDTTPVAATTFTRLVNYVAYGT
jgi:hypothetical protein